MNRLLLSKTKKAAFKTLPWPRNIVGSMLGGITRGFVPRPEIVELSKVIAFNDAVHVVCTKEVSTIDRDSEEILQQIIDRIYNIAAKFYTWNIFDGPDAAAYLAFSIASFVLTEGRFSPSHGYNPNISGLLIPSRLVIDGVLTRDVSTVNVFGRGQLLSQGPTDVAHKGKKFSGHIYNFAFKTDADYLTSLFLYFIWEAVRYSARVKLVVAPDQPIMLQVRDIIQVFLHGLPDYDFISVSDNDLPLSALIKANVALTTDVSKPEISDLVLADLFEPSEIQTLQSSAASRDCCKLGWGYSADLYHYFRSKGLASHKDNRKKGGDYDS